MRPPRLVGNQGESGEFVLPLKLPVAPGTGPEKEAALVSLLTAGGASK